MEFEKEFVEQHGLSEDQVKALVDATNANEATLKKQWDGKANQDAENILTGAIGKVAETTQVQRNQGEKVADYISRAWDTFNESKSKELTDKLTQVEEQLKKAPGNEHLAKQFDELKGKYDALQAKEAEFDKLVNSGVQDKYDTLSKDYTGLQETIAFQGVKPAIPDTVNKYEADVKWNAFVATTKETNNIIIDQDGVAWAVDKENEHKRSKLVDLVEKDDTLSQLVAGRQQRGPGGKEMKTQKIEGLPFEMPEGADSAARSKAIKEYLQKEENIDAMHPKFTERFNELNMIALGKKKPAAA